MSKKDKKDRSKEKQEKKDIKIIGISKRGKRTIGIGIGVLILGFIILTQTDPAGQNWASHLSPFLIIGGYVIIGIGIVLPDKIPSTQTNPASENK
ncbi:MAG: hypothetical protein ABII27_07595 [bacterium]